MRSYSRGRSQRSRIPSGLCATTNASEFARRTKFVQGSRRYAAMYTWDNPVAVRLRNAFLGMLPNPGVERRERKMLEFV